MQCQKDEIKVYIRGLYTNLSKHLKFHTYKPDGNYTFHKGLNKD